MTSPKAQAYSYQARQALEVKDVIGEASIVPAIAVSGSGAFGSIGAAADVTFTVTSDLNSSLKVVAAGDNAAFQIKTIMGRQTLTSSNQNRLNDTEFFWLPLSESSSSTFVITATAADDGVAKTMTLSLYAGGDTNRLVTTIALSKTYVAP